MFLQIPEEYLGQLSCTVPRLHPNPRIGQVCDAQSVAPNGSSGDNGDNGCQSIIRNASYNNVFERFGNLDISIAVICCKLRDNPNMVRPPVLPENVNTKIYLAFDTKGLCNTYCGIVGDCVPHSKEQDEPLLVWCIQCYTVT